MLNTAETDGVASSARDSRSEGPSIESCSERLGHGCSIRSGAQRNFVVLSESSRYNMHAFRERAEMYSITRWMKIFFSCTVYMQFNLKQVFREFLYTKFWREMAMIK